MAFRFFPRNNNPEVVQFQIFARLTFATESSNVIVSMNTVTCKIPCGVLETESQTIKSGQDKRNWAQYSQAIAVLMSRRMSELGMMNGCLPRK